MSTPYNSSMIPPPISNEPPPLGSSSEDEDSEEFRTPAGLRLDVASAEPSPLSTPRKSLKSKEQEPLPDQVHGAENGQDANATDNDEEAFEDTVELTVVQRDGEEEEDDFGDFTARSRVEEDVVCSVERSDEENVIEQNGEGEQEAGVEFKEARNEGPGVDVSVSKEGEQTAFATDEFGDFIEETATDSMDVNLSEQTNPQMDMDESAKHDDDEDDFGDFACTVAESTAKSLPPSSETCHEVATDEAFADFKDIQEPSGSAFHTQQSFRRRSSTDFMMALESKFDSLVKSLIPPVIELVQDHNSDEALIVLDKVLTEEGDSCWKHTLDFEGSRSLMYKWLNSSYQQRLYRSLNIDTSTIMYTDKWGAVEVPRFAAGMVEMPILQPQVCSSPASAESASPSLTSPARIPPSSQANQDKSDVLPITKPLSMEAQQIIQRIPDLSFMNSQTIVYPQSKSTSTSRNHNPLV